MKFKKNITVKMKNIYGLKKENRTEKLKATNEI